jgi:hypothetical protein
MARTSDIRPESSGSDPHPPGVPANGLQRFGRAMLLVSNLLVIAAFFTPWLEYTTSFGSHPGRYAYSPLFLLQSGISGIALAGLGVPFLGILGCTSGVLVARSRHGHVQRVFLAFLALQACGYLCAMFFLMSFILMGLNLGSYGSFTHSDGIWVAVAGFGGILLGALVLLDARHHASG